MMMIARKRRFPVFDRSDRRCANWQIWDLAGCSLRSHRNHAGQLWMRCLSVRAKDETRYAVLCSEDALLHSFRETTGADSSVSMIS